MIAITLDVGSIPEARFQASLAATKVDQDLALLQIDRDLQGNRLVLGELNLPALPIADVTNLFDKEFRVLGYPTSGGEISIDRTYFRRYDDNRGLIIVDRQLEPGNSGGPVLTEQTDGFAVAGIVIRRRTTQGQLNPEGLVRAIDQLQSLIWTPGIVRAWGEGITARVAHVRGENVLQLGLSINALDVVNRQLELYFYVTNTTTKQPWQPANADAPLVLWTDVKPQQVIAQQTLTLTAPVEILEIAPDRLRFWALVWDRDEGETLWADDVGVQVPAETIVLVDTATPTLTPVPTATNTLTPQPTATTEVTATDTVPPVEAGDDPADQALSPISALDLAAGQIAAVAYAPNGESIAAATASGLWLGSISGDDGQLYATTSPLTSVSWSPDGLLVATGVGDTANPTASAGQLLVWNGATGEVLLVFDEPQAAALSIAWSPDGKYLAVGAADEMLYLYDAVIGELASTLGSHGAPVWSVAWSPDSSQVAASSEDEGVRIWQVESGETTLTLEGIETAVWALAWSPDGAMLASGDNVGAVTIWDAATGAPLLTVDTLPNPMVALAWSTDSQRIAAATGAQVDEDEAAIRIWDIESGALRANLRSDGATPTSLAWLEDGTILLAGTLEGDLLQWQLLQE